MQNDQGVWIVVLSNSQRLALIDLILEQMAARGGTATFVDVGAGQITTPLDLLEAVDRAQWTCKTPVTAKRAGH
jgi:hypothetical protein